MAEEEGKGFVFHTPDGDQELTFEEVQTLAADGDPGGLYAMAMAYLFGWDVECNNNLHSEIRLLTY